MKAGICTYHFVGHDDPNGDGEVEGERDGRAAEPLLLALGPLRAVHLVVQGAPQLLQRPTCIYAGRRGDIKSVDVN